MPTSSRHTRRGFSLVELSVVVAIMSVVAVLGLEAAANFIERANGAITRDKLATIDDAVARFYKIYGRLPCPAVITAVPTTDTTYGQEDCTLGTFGGTVGGGLVRGGVPFRNLNLPPSYAVDPFNDKLYYVVTKNLTRAGTGSGQFGHATDGEAGIEVRTGILEQPCGGSKCQILADASTTPSGGAAYLILSVGADRRGAYSAQGVDLSASYPCAIATADTDKRIDAQNCVFGSATIAGYLAVPPTNTDIPLYVFYDSHYSNGLVMKNYFDDYVVWRTKARL